MRKKAKLRKHLANGDYHTTWTSSSAFTSIRAALKDSAAVAAAAASARARIIAEVIARASSKSATQSHF